MKVVFAAPRRATLAALLLAGASGGAAFAAAPACTAPPAPGGVTRTVPEGHAKASSFAPSHSRKRSYGAPIPRPIIARHGKSKKKPAPRALKAVAR